MTTTHNTTLEFDMRVKTVSVTYERKFNLGNYNSANLGVTLWADLEETESVENAIPELQRQAREFVRAEYARLEK